MAQTVLVYTAQQGARIQSAVGIALALGRDANGGEIHDWTWNLVKSNVRAIESQAGHQAVVEPPDLGNAT